MNHPHKEDGKVLYTIKPGKKLDRGSLWYYSPYEKRLVHNPLK
jgi:hypothetical protein